MLKKSLVFLLVVVHFMVLAQTPQVPSTIEFADIKLKIDKHAQELIQANVNLLTRHPKSFQVMVDRANIYFPIIERILIEEGVPEDFKYLVLQESGLIPNAVSTSNAVGYWQFKKESASDVNVLVNGDVDERMHIVAATRGAAKYLKKNNIYLSNWVNALLSYNLGLGGVRLLVDPQDANATSMKLDRRTHVYILKFLGHKIAFENALKQTPAQYTLLEYKKCNNKSLKEIAKELDLNEADLLHYNQWLKSKKVPENRAHSVIVPASKENYEKLSALVGDSEPFYSPDQAQKSSVGVVSTTKHENRNGLKAIVAGNNETIESLSKKGKISKNKFIRYNELAHNDKIIPGQVYYLQAKKNKGDHDYHTAEGNETYWSISQRFGIKKSRLLRFNRIARNEKLQEGRVLWLAETRPVIIPVEIKVPEKPTTSKPVQEVQVVTYPDKRSISPAPTQTASSPEMFPEDFYEEQTSTEGSKPTETPTVIKVSNENSHEVKKGETLYSISKQYGVGIEELKRWNNLQNNTLEIGQTLVINKLDSVNSSLEISKNESYITYTVRTGDSIYKIAKEHNVTIKQLQEWNNKTDHNIFIGEQLKIYRN